jgi:hypothetical protein
MPARQGHFGALAQVSVIWFIYLGGIGRISVK